MEFGQYLLGWLLAFLLVFCIFAAPVILAAILFRTAIWGAETAWGRAASGNRVIATAGFSVLAITAVIAYLALDYFAGPEVEPPVLTIMQPHARTGGDPAPRILLVDDYRDRVAPLALLESGEIDEVLSATYEWKTKTGAKRSRAAFWSAARLKAGTEGCEHIFASRASPTKKLACVDFVPLSFTPPQRMKPHFLVEAKRQYNPTTETTTFYLVNGLNGRGRQTIAYCTARWAKTPYMFTWLPTYRRNAAVNRKLAECKRAAYERLLSLVDVS